ncbi:chloride channel protein CLC-e [Primulina tabacum]|uniref:chloride channel protein CLC-e n=1 Tax=Primulina tabacum TaxID=48773 RepID=UPI003F5A1857
MNIALAVSSNFATATPAVAIAGNYDDSGSPSPPPPSSSAVRHGCRNRRRQSLCLISSSSLLAYRPRDSLYGFYCSSSSTAITPRLFRRIPPRIARYEEELEEEKKLELFNDDQSSMAAEVVSYQEAVLVPGPDEDCDGNNDQPWRLQFGGDSSILSACFVGLFTGITVVIFNYAVHEIRDLCWDEIPNQGASWLREQPLEAKWARVIFVPAFGGLVVSVLKMIQAAIDNSTRGSVVSNLRSSLKPILNTVAACVTLGTGNSLGPEGPSVEIGVSVAKGVGSLVDRGGQRKLSLRAAGSAAGLSSGFNAAVAGCFFAVESVLWPSPTESSLSITNTTSMVILSAVIASVISEVGLGSEPAFAVPVYDFRSPSELPLYLLLGVLCGLVSIALSKSTSFMMVLCDEIKRDVGIPKAAFPILGGLAVGLMALAYPEILYWGFQNVDLLLESRPFVGGLSAGLLLQVVLVKIVATSLCRACGLVGGYYAPSLFIGAAAGMAYGKAVGYLFSVSNEIFHLSILEVASPQAYGLVGMAATLAGVCEVPLTAVLLLFELTQDYRIVLPLLGAVGLSSWTKALSTRKSTIDNTRDPKDTEVGAAAPEEYSDVTSVQNSVSSSYLDKSNGSSICELESSLCLNDDYDDDLANEILVSEAMRIQYVTVLMSSSLTEVVYLMLEKKQSCAVIVDDKTQLIGQITLSDIQQFIESSKIKSEKPQVLKVSKLCSSYAERCRVTWTVTPNTSLLTALTLMNKHKLSQIPVIMEHVDSGGCPVGLLDRVSIDLAKRAFTIQEALSWEKMKN